MINYRNVQLRNDLSTTSNRYSRLNRPTYILQWSALCVQIIRERERKNKNWMQVLKIRIYASMRFPSYEELRKRLNWNMNVPLFLCSTRNEYKDVGERFALKGIKRIRTKLRAFEGRKEN